MKTRSPRSLRNTEGFQKFVLDQLEGLDVVPRSMFGGCGLYCGADFFGIIAADVLYLKVDETNRQDYERAGMEPFKPYPDRSGTMSYFAVPVSVLESKPDLEQWAQAAIKVAQRAKQPLP
jgi:DNA transformation protein